MGPRLKRNCGNEPVSPAHYARAEFLENIASERFGFQQTETRLTSMGISKFFLPQSGCVSFQAFARHFFGDHGVRFLIMALRMTSSLRMQAVMTTLKGLPAASRRLANSRMTGL